MIVSVTATWLLLTANVATAPAARVALLVVICPDKAFSVTPADLADSWLTEPPAPAA